MLRFNAIILFLVLACGHAAPLSALTKRPPKPQPILQMICGPYRVLSVKLLSFTGNEKKLICGDPEVPAWEKIPTFQAHYFLRNFLQSRGYAFPTFEEREGLIIVHPGEITTVHEIEVTGDPPPSLKIHKRRLIKGQPLTPALLTELEKWTKNRLNENGYPCPTVTLTAEAATGTIVVAVDPGPFQRIAQVSEEPIPELDTRVLRRYDAFQVGDPYQSTWLRLTERRVEDDGILQNTYFTTACTDAGAVLTQKSTAGKPRLFIIGLGANTEGIVLGKATWKHTRLGSKGSSIALTAFGSYREQRLDAEAFWYLLSTPSRWYLNPLISFKREDEIPYELITADVRMTPAWTWDGRKIGLGILFGPAFQFTETFRGADEGFTKFLSGLFQMTIRTHEFEYFADEPRAGFAVNFRMNLNHDKLFSSASAQKFSVTGEKLWNVGGFSPPLLVFGMRGGLASTLANREQGSFSTLPPTFLYYLGGSSTLRGFNRKEIPEDDIGALTAAFASLEARLVRVLPLNIQPVAFVDVGVVGGDSFDVDWPLFWSPGFGARWPSPIGVLRATIAHGYLVKNNVLANDQLSHWQFYFSFGEEF